MAERRASYQAGWFLAWCMFVAGVVLALLVASIIATAWYFAAPTSCPAAGEYRRG